MSYIKLAYFGHHGSFSYIAAEKYIKQKRFEKYRLLACENMDELIKNVLTGNTYGVVPYYNNLAGKVHDHSELDTKYKSLIIDEVSIATHHYLLAKEKLVIGNIQRVYTHPQALSQCQLYLKRNLPAVSQESYTSTSTAAKDLSSGVLPAKSAVIGSKLAAKIYNLVIIDSEIEDHPNNTTYFKVLFKP